MRPLRELWAGHEEEDDEEEGFDQIGRFNLGFLLLLHKYWCYKLCFNFSNTTLMLFFC